MDFDYWKSKTSKIITGCGNLYITIDYNRDSTIHRVRIHRNSKFVCPLTMRDTLARQATFQARRDPKQLIKDLRGSEHNFCDKFDIGVKTAMKRGKLAAYSCADAIARVLDEKKESTFTYPRSPSTTKLGYNV